MLPQLGARGNLHLKRRALAQGRLDPDASTVHLDDLLGDGEPETSPVPRNPHLCSQIDRPCYPSLFECGLRSQLLDAGNVNGSINFFENGTCRLEIRFGDRVVAFRSMQAE
jgi:hypothetical protein